MTFRFLAESRKVEFLRENGTMLGIRYRNGRRLFLYMLKDFFIEVTYQADDLEMTPEKMEIFSSLEHLNTYLERDIKSAF